MILKNDREKNVLIKLIDFIESRNLEVVQDQEKIVFKLPNYTAILQFNDIWYINDDKNKKTLKVTIAFGLFRIMWNNS